MSASAAGAHLIVVDEVAKRYRTASGPVDALRNVSLRVADGEFCTLIGPSGCGKSTLLSMLAGLVMPDHGHVGFRAAELFAATALLSAASIGIVLALDVVNDRLSRWRV